MASKEGLSCPSSKKWYVLGFFHIFVHTNYQQDAECHQHVMKHGTSISFETITSFTCAEHENTMFGVCLCLVPLFKHVNCKLTLIYIIIIIINVTAWERKIPFWDWQFPFGDRSNHFRRGGGRGGKAKCLKKIYISHAIFNIPDPPCIEVLNNFTHLYTTWLLHEYSPNIGPTLLTPPPVKNTTVAWQMSATRIYHMSWVAS